MDDLLDTADIADLLKCTREHVTDRLTKRADFPRPRVNLSQKLKRWAREDVVAWMARPKRRAA
jgi:predicted DNA-binding transcriptional regulator AlpA